MKLIYEYLRVVTEVPDSKEIDLCTESGRLLGIYEAPCSASGLQYFKPRSNYFVLTFDYIEGTGELYGAQTLMHYTNHDFEAVFAKIKRAFGIPTTEPIDDDDASLIYEHLLLAYQQKLDLIFESTSPSHSMTKASTHSIRKLSPDRKKRSQSIALSAQSKSHETSVLSQWREEKQAKLAASRAEESEENTKRPSSIVRSSLDNEIEVEGAENYRNEEALPEEHLDDQRNLRKPKELQKRSSQTTGKKGVKKQSKKTGKEGKEDAKLQQAAACSSTVSLTPKPSFRALRSKSTIQLHPSASAGLDDIMKTLYISKSSLFAKSDFADPEGPTQRRPHGSIRQFFIDHPASLTELPRPPVVNLNTEVTTTKEKRMRKKKKKLLRFKNKKIAVRSRTQTMKLRKLCRNK